MTGLTATDVETVREGAMVLRGYMRGELAGRVAEVASRLESALASELTDTAEVGLEQRLQTDVCEAFHLDNGQQLNCVFLYGHHGPCADRYGRRFGCL